MQVLRKISARTVFGTKADIQALVLADRKSIHGLFRVVGLCNGTRTGASEETEGKDAGKLRDWTAMLGQFEATSFKTGQKFRSGVCFLPNYVTDAITGQLTPDGEPVKFAFDLGAKFDETSATSYVYEALNLIEPAADDPLAVLGAMADSAKALPVATDAPKAIADAGKKK